MESKGVTTHMNALNEYFLMVVFMLLLLNRDFDRETRQWKS